MRYFILLAASHTVFLMLHCGQIEAQFVDASLDYLMPSSTQAEFLGGGMSFSDFNSDGLDDLTFSDYQGELKFYQQGEDGLEFVDLGIEFEGEPKGVLWFDYDNDGDQDLMLAVNNAPNKLWCNEDGVFYDCSSFAGIEAATDWMTFGLSAGDYDLDGFLDVYMCNYHDGAGSTQPNILYHNNGDGTFTDVTAIAGVGNGLAHTFQSVWFEYDFDGYPDLFVINDRDVFPNALYHNQGDGTFINIAPAVGADQSISAMSATVGDADNDGDFDIFCSDVIDSPNLLLEKNEAGYADLSVWSGVAGDLYSWGGAWIDYDGDMWLDLLVATYRFPLTIAYDNYMYHHMGESLSFSNVSEDWPNGERELYCLGRGDINQDLAPDIVAHGNSSAAQVLVNTASPANGGAGRLTIRLHGTVSNPDAIGAIIRVYAGDIVQMRQVRCGEDYLTQHAQTQFFGLGDNAYADSVTVDWPSGIHDVWTGVVANEAYFFVERSTHAQILIQGSLCFGEEAEAQFDMEPDEVYWNGELSPQGGLELDTSGVYALEARWLNGLFVVHDTLIWESELPLELTVGWSPPACYGEPGVLVWQASELHSVLWGDQILPHQGESDTTLAGLLLLGLVSDINGCSATFEFDLSSPSALELSMDYHPALCADDTAWCAVSGLGGTPEYVLDWGVADPTHLLSGVWPVQLTDTNGCEVFDTLNVWIPEPLVLTLQAIHEDEQDGEVSVDIQGGTPPFEILWNNLETGQVIDSLTAGIYSCVVEDAGGCLAVAAIQIVNVGMVDFDANHDDCSSWGVHRSAGRISMFAPLNCSAASIQVFALDGRLMSSAACLGSDCSIAVQDGSSVIVALFDAEGRCQYRSWLPPTP